MITKSTLKRYIDRAIKKEIKRLASNKTRDDAMWKDELSSQEKEFYKSFLRVKEMPQYAKNLAKKNIYWQYG